MPEKSWRIVRLEETLAKQLDELATELFATYTKGSRDSLPGGKPVMPSHSSVVAFLLERYRDWQARRKKADQKRKAGRKKPPDRIEAPE